MTAEIISVTISIDVNIGSTIISYIDHREVFQWLPKKKQQLMLALDQFYPHHRVYIFQSAPV